MGTGDNTWLRIRHGDTPQHWWQIKDERQTNLLHDPNLSQESRGVEFAAHAKGPRVDDLGRDLSLSSLVGTTIYNAESAPPCEWRVAQDMAAGSEVRGGKELRRQGVRR